MRIVQGRGNNRKVTVLPSGGIVSKASDTEQGQFLTLVCNILDVH